MTILKKIENLNRLFIYKIISIYHKSKTKRQTFPVKYDKLLIFRYDAIGDMIVTTSVFSYLKSLFPSSQIDILASNRNDSIVKNDSRLKNIWTLPSNFIDKIKLMNQLKKENYDYIFCFILHKTGKAAFYANLCTNTNTRIVAMKHSDENRNKLYSRMFDIQVDTEDLRDKMTMAELQVRIVARALNLDENIAKTELKLYLSEINIEYVKSFLSEKNISTQFIVLNVSSGNSYRTWSIGKNQEFLNQILNNNSELIVVLSFSPDDNDKAEQIASINQDRVILFDSGNDFLNTCALIDKASIVITPDTSIVHVAASFNIPVLVLYSRLSTYLNEWAPYGVDYEMVITSGKEPIDTLKIDEVVEAFERLIKKVHPK